MRAAARKDGTACRRAELQKHQRYPGPQLVAFAAELPGRLGSEARQWLKHHVQQLPHDLWTEELTRAYKAVSCAIEKHMALQLRRSRGLK